MVTLGPKAINMTGRRFGRLVVIACSERRHAAGHSRLMWRCQCDCGGEATAATHTLTSGHSRSCGCVQREVVTQRSTKHGHSPAGKSSPEYISWASAKGRCTNPSEASFSRYGGRGIRMDARWLTDFSAFLSDMGPRPSQRYSLDRLDVNGHYEPGNCRWATAHEQAQNKRSTVRITANGETLRITEWAVRLGCKVGTLYSRRQYGWSDDDIVNRPLGKTTGGRTGCEQVARRRAVERQATPLWLTKQQRKEMRAVYKKAAKDGLHVDHIIPVLGRLATGLHVPWNLQVVTKQTNWSKNNRF